MMTQSTVAVAQEPTDEVNTDSAVAQYLKQQVEAITKTERSYATIVQTNAEQELNQIDEEP